MLLYRNTDEPGVKPSIPNTSHCISSVYYDRIVNALAYWLIGLDELPSKYRVSLMSFFCDKIMIRHLPGKLMGGSYGTDQNNAH